jgi:hypothetical protein
MNNITYNTGLFGILLGAFIFILDYFSILLYCRNCKIEVIVIFILGFLMIVPAIRSKFLNLIINVFSIIGIITSVDQVFNSLEEIFIKHDGYATGVASQEYELLLSTLSLLLISTQIIMINFRRFPKLAASFQP